MVIKKQTLVIMIALIGVLAIGNVWAAVAGANTDSPSGPTDGASQMFTLEQIYARLDTGAAGAKMTTFTEPAVGPGTGTMQTLDEVMGAAPAVDDTSGASAAEVEAGKTFWGLTSGEWGTQTGTAPAIAHVQAGVPPTGQTQCYDSGGSAIPCGGTGQDGEYQMGINWVLEPSYGFKGAYTTPRWTGVRFTDNGDGTVTDNVTGLIWLQDANCIATEYPGFDIDWTAGDGRVTWQTGLNFVAGINAGTYVNCGGGQTDWRLPNINELHSLVDLTQSNPALPAGHPFTAVQSNYYWSSTSFEAYPSNAWLVYLGHGAVNDGNKTVDRYVWPVRAGQ